MKPNEAMGGHTKGLCGFDSVAGIHDMRALYAHLKIYPTSENGDKILIRAHIAYHCGERAAERAAIKPSRGHSYRVAMYGTHGKDDLIVRIVDYYDHRDGLRGIVSEATSTN